jgi:hypothetical protein
LPALTAHRMRVPLGNPHSVSHRATLESSRRRAASARKNF